MDYLEKITIPDVQRRMWYVLVKSNVITAIKGATSLFVHLEKFSLNFSSWSFAIHVNLLHPQPPLFRFGLLLLLWCFSILPS